MKYSEIKVLLLDGESRQTLTVLYGLKALGCKVTVVCRSKLDVCHASRFPDAKMLFNSTDYEDELKAFILTQVKSGKYDVLIPVAPSTKTVTLNRDELGKFVRIVCADKDAYMQTYDKQLTFEKALETGVPCPLTRMADEPLDDYLDKVNYPIIIKPRVGTGSVGFKKLNHREQLEKLVQDGVISPDEYVIQEFIPAKQMRGVNMFIADGEVKGAVANQIVRRYPVDAGTATIIRSVKDDRALELSKRLLNAMGWRGYADLSYLIDDRDGSLRLMEINGRVNASIKLYTYCGNDLANQMIAQAYNDDIPSYPVNAKLGLSVRHSQADILWFIHSPDRFSSHPSWFDQRKTKDVVFSIKDPIPYLVYSMQHIKAHKEYERKRDRTV